MHFFEAMMLVCFGIAWPLSIRKSLKTKIVRGKSPLFMIVIAFGYTFGIIYKYYALRDWVIYLYAVNLIMVLIDLSLYYYYSIKNKTLSSIVS